MAQNIETFNSSEFGTLRTLMVGDEPWFVARDVCDALDLSNTTVAIQSLDDDERAKFNLGRQGEANLVSEAGFYKLVMRSRKPEAKAFQRWVTHEVLPSIRKRGGYLTPEKVEEVLLNPDTIIRLATDLKEERARRAELERENAAMAPKALFADAVASSDTSILIGELAKLLRQNGVSIGQNRLFEWMRENGFLMKAGSSRNMPTQRAMEMGLFEVKERTIANPDGSVRITKTPKVTGKGQSYFVNRFLAKEVA